MKTREASLEPGPAIEPTPSLLVTLPPSLGMTEADSNDAPPRQGGLSPLPQWNYLKSLFVPD